jgi:hypothetical protein
MTASPSPPKPRRRRWIIAGVLLFVASCAVWWHSPRGDARFVGKWDIKYNDQPGTWSTYKLNSSGRGTWIHPSGDSSFFFWRIEAGRLIMGIPSESLLSRVFRPLQIVVWHLTGFDIPRIEEAFDIVEVSEGVIRLDAHVPDGSKGRMVLTRIPE